MKNSRGELQQVLQLFMQQYLRDILGGLLLVRQYQNKFQLLIFQMDKKGHLLSNLKRQVLALKNQLEGLQMRRQAKVQKAAYNSKNTRSVNYSSRFDSISLDCSYLNKGIKKFYQNSPKFKNIADLIKEKSQPERRPILSSQRKAENQRTKQNFSSEQPERSKSRSKSPNPLTGQGYNDKKSGKKNNFEPRKQVEARPCSKKPFNLYY